MRFNIRRKGQNEFVVVNNPFMTKEEAEQMIRTNMHLGWPLYLVLRDQENPEVHVTMKLLIHPSRQEGDTFIYRSIFGDFHITPGEDVLKIRFAGDHFPVQTEEGLSC